jgi:RNA polymerase sigma-70 factor (family 1)
LQIAPLYTEPDLLALFRAGDQTAFRQLFNHYYVSILFYAEQITAAKTEAEDIVQEIFCKLWQHRASFNSLLHIKSFLYKSTRFACIDHLRQLQSRDKRYELLLQKAEDESLQNSAMIEEELYRAILAEIDQLPEKHRVILRLKFIDNLDYADIATQLGLPEATVRKQKQRALEQLRTLVLKKRLLTLLTLQAILRDTP